jgi:hypothetical protein
MSNQTKATPEKHLSNNKKPLQVSHDKASDKVTIEDSSDGPSKQISLLKGNNAKALLPPKVSHKR